MTSETKIKELEEVTFNDPIVLEGLPGIGFVGKIVVDQIIKQTDATKFAELNSDYFPPQVTVKADGLVDHMKNEFYYVKDFGSNNQDIILLTGNSQGSDHKGQTAISKVLINYFEDLGAKKIFTLGGLGTGEMVEDHKVFVAGNSKDLVDSILELDNTSIRKDEGGAIVGASGILLYYAQEKGIDAACLMGETPGFYVDPYAARELLLVLFDVLDFEIDLDELNEKVDATLKTLSNNPQLGQQLGMNPNANRPNDDLRYIG
ncbi:MAG: proteasome assembly chaperone family protein [Methanosphaera sp.]|nr:proteasome assembly chaperone family protein [Methanosphaera sp.]